MWQSTKGSLRLPFAALALVLTGGALLAGCASGAADSLEQDVAQLRQDVNALSLSVHRSRGDSETALSQVDRRTRSDAAETTRRLSALATRVDGMAAELSRVSARLEDVSVRLEGLGRQLASRATPAPSPGQAPVAITPAAPPGSGGGASAEQAYQVAYLDFTKGSYPLAVSGFREIIRRFPDSPLADKAQYWVGESYFSLARASAEAGRTQEASRQFEQAVQEFRRVIVNYPRGEKVPTALYKEALALLELKQPRLAQARLQYLLEHFPQSEEAPLARERLASIPG